MSRTFPDAMPDIAAVAAVLADASRAAMCMALMDGRAWTAGELGKYAGIDASTVSRHLDKMIDVRLAEDLRQGRHRYVRLRESAAPVVEALGAFARAAVPTPPSLSAVGRNTRIREARTCYSHLAGRFGVALAADLRHRGLLDEGWRITEVGGAAFADVGLPGLGGASGVACLDSTERRHHLAGDAGGRLCAAMFDAGWIVRTGRTRAVSVTDLGRRQLSSLGCDASLGQSAPYPTSPT